MKTAVNVDFGWALTSALRYARRQVMMIEELKSNNVDMTQVIRLIMESKTADEVVNELIRRFNLSWNSAKEIMESPLIRLSSLDEEYSLDYYSRVAKSLTPLFNEFYNRI